MNLKEFLKPDKRKLMTFLLIIALALVLTVIIRLFCPAQEVDTAVVGVVGIFTASVCNTSYLLPRMLLRLPIYYLLACIGILIHDRYIKKKSVI